MKLSTSSLAGPVLVTAAVALLAAGCGSSSPGDTASASGGAGTAAVSVTSVDGTDVLVDADGHSLYSAAVEKGGQIHCVGSCTSFWAPMIATGADVTAADHEVGSGFAVADRPDGRSQLTYRGLPLYAFTQEPAGALQGDGFTDDFQGTHFVWTAARAPGAAASSPAASQTPDSGGGGFGY